MPRVLWVVWFSEETRVGLLFQSCPSLSVTGVCAPKVTCNFTYFIFYFIFYFIPRQTFAMSTRHVFERYEKKPGTPRLRASTLIVSHASRMAHTVSARREPCICIMYLFHPSFPAVYTWNGRVAVCLGRKGNKLGDDECGWQAQACLVTIIHPSHPGQPSGLFKRKKYQQLMVLLNPLPREPLLLLLPVSPTAIQRRHSMNAHNRHLNSSYWNKKKEKMEGKNVKKEKKSVSKVMPQRKTLVRTPHTTHGSFPFPLIISRLDTGTTFPFEQPVMSHGTRSRQASY